MKSRNESHSPVHSRPVIFGATLAAFLIGDAIFANDVNAQSTIVMPTIVRDVRRDHPDFNIIPSAGYGHYAGNMSLSLSASQRPQFSGGGYSVGSEWTDKQGRPIAPHLFTPGLFVPVVNSPTADKNTVTDSYDPNAGVYDPALAGDAPKFVPASAMPVALAPPPMPPLVDEIHLSSKVVSYLSADVHCRKFIVDTSHTLVVNGNINMLVKDLFHLRDISTVVEIPAGSSLTIFFEGKFLMEDQASLNSSANPDRVRIINLGTEPIQLQDQAMLAAHVLSPNAPMEMTNDAQFFGRYAGESVDMLNGSEFHLDEMWSITACGDTIDDNPGAPSSASTGGITSVASFDSWFHDVLGTNLSQIHYLTLTQDPATGVYSYASPAFHPIDNRLYGNEGDAHNNYFTMSFTASFTYTSCGGQFFGFAGSDDAWLYVDGKLAMDLGGIQPGTPQFVDVDRLELVDGQTYSMHFFYAQRSPLSSDFNLLTNVDLVPPTVTATGTGSWD